MTDRELLEMAAKAAWIVGVWHDRGQCIHVTDCAGMSDIWWRPFDDDGDALRLAVDLKLQLIIYKDWVEILQDGIRLTNADSVYSAGCMRETTRRAIVRAAAAIGSAM